MRSMLICLILVSSLAQAHDLWVEQSGKHWMLYQGHRHSTHVGAETLAYGSNFVTAAKCLDERGSPSPLTVTGTSPWTASGDCAALLIEMSSGYWSKTPWETKNVPKNEAPGVIRSWLSKEQFKRLGRWTPAMAQPLTDGLDIVPQSDPFALKPGEKLVVRVANGGRPLTGVPVAYHGDTRGETDPDGRVAIRLRHGGLQLISASVELPLKDGKADIEMRAATLQFELPK